MFISGLRSLRAACLIAVLIELPQLASADPFVEPKVFASSGGVLDLLVIAKERPIETILFPLLTGGPPINPIGWVFEICPRPAQSNVCPAGGSTVADFGGVRLALQQSDTLKIRLVNKLPLLDPAKVKHVTDPGGANLYLNPTNLHTHGLVVPARAPTLSDPTFGDYIFVELYNPANGTPPPQATHQHGSVKMDYADYRIDIPANHPSGAFWFHPHIHGLTVNQLTSGLAGIISIGNVQDNVVAAPSVVRHLILKDIQVVAAGKLQVDSGEITVADGEVLNQQILDDFCEPRTVLGRTFPRPGYCPGANAELSTENDFTGARWYFTINGQVLPTIHMTSSDGEIWRLTNASAQITYKLNLLDNSTHQPILMQLISIDGVSINVPPGISPGTVMAMGGNRYTVVDCQKSGSNSLPVCVTDMIMMPSSRAEVWVTYRDSNGNVVPPPSGATATFHQAVPDLGPAGERLQDIDLATVEFAQQSTTKTSVDVIGNAKVALSPAGIFGAPAAKAAAAPPPAAACRPLAAGHHRRIFYGVVDPTDPDTTFGLGYEEIDQNGLVVVGTQAPLIAFDPVKATVCVPLGPGGAPVHETWEVVNLATENHSFHIHQTKFTVLDAAALPPASRQPGHTTAAIIEDNVPIPYATANIADIADNQGGYCTIQQWRDGQCTSHTIVVDIPFAELGDFVYHCHISEHSDDGMMAKIRVVPGPEGKNTSTHDFDGDGKSDILWKHTAGSLAMWLMYAAQISQTNVVSTVPGGWSVVGIGDYNGDAMSDILWRHSSGPLAMWLMNGAQVVQATAIGTVATAWSVAGTGDFDGNGKSDILWRHTSGNLAIWLMNGAQVVQSVSVGTVPAAWSVAGTGDFNGDGKSDILWRHASGALVLWLMNGTQMPQSTTIGTVATDWSVVGIGDFNGDGKSDILWRHTNGALVLWLMNGGQILQAISLGTVPTTWSVIETGDFDGDGKSDVLWRDTSGTVALWLMNGGTVLQTLNIATIGTDWQIQNAN